MHTGIMQIIKEKMPEAITVVLGEVKSVSPITIQIAGDEKLLLSENLLIIPQHLTRHSVVMDIPKLCEYVGQGTCIHDGENATVIIHSELKAGETVYLLDDVDTR